jgi:putative ABC transport system permease protein
VKTQLEHDGLVLMVANATYSEDTGRMEIVRPPVFDEDVLNVLRSDVPGVTAVAPIGNTMGGGMGGGMFSEVAVGGTTYRIRNVVSTGEDYGSVMDFTMAAGSFITQEDVQSGARKVVLSSTLAGILYGSAEAAVGQTLSPPAPTLPAGSTASTAQGFARRTFVMPTFTVVGVFQDPAELQRTSYGVGDMILPYTAFLPRGVNVSGITRFMMSTVAVRVRGESFATAQAQIRAALAAKYGDDVAVQVWEGTPRGETATLQEARGTVATFSLVVNLLGFVLLVTGSIGILSIMLVEVLGRTREISLERALGASRSVITREYFLRSLILSGLSAVVGVVLALVLAHPLRDLVVPIFRGVSTAQLGGNVIGIGPVGIAVAASLVVGGVFGIFPVLPALHTNIADGMREG